MNSNRINGHHTAKTIALLVALTLTLLLAPLSALAWDSYDSTLGSPYLRFDPLHEDITQMAYAALTSSFADGAYNNLLHVDPTAPDAESQYQEIVYFLRQGAYWNDFSANNASEFVTAYLNKDEISDYRLDKYEHAWQVGEHINETTKHYGKNGDGSRSLVKFSNNGRVGFLHAMASKVSAKKDAKDVWMHKTEALSFMMEWLKFAYDYAQGNFNPTTATQEEKGLANFIDPNWQVNYDSSFAPAFDPNSPTPADDAISYRQARLRALGMICHTLEDSFNPAHTNRGYREGQAVTHLGIMDFNNSEKQSLHEGYDRISTRDDATRKIIRSSQMNTFANARVNKTSIDNFFKNATTLGLGWSGDFVSGLLTHFYKGEPWSQLYPWLIKDKQNLAILTSVYTVVTEGSRRVGDFTMDLQTAAHVLDNAFNKTFFSAGAERWGSSELASCFDALQAYQLDQIDYFTNRATTQGYHQPGAEDPIYDAIDKITKKLQDHTKNTSPEEWKAFEELPEIYHLQIEKMLSTLECMVLEFNIERQGIWQPLGDNHPIGYIISARNNFQKHPCKQVMKGRVESVFSDGGFLLAVEQDRGTVALSYDGSVQIQKGQGVTVAYSTSPHEKLDSVYEMKATSVTIDDREPIYTARGTIKSVGVDTVSFLSDAMKLNGVPELLLNTQTDMSATIKKDDYVILKYKILNKLPLVVGATQLDAALKPTDGAQTIGKIIDTYANLLSIRPEGYENHLTTDGYSWLSTDVHGSLSANTPVRIVYQTDATKTLKIVTGVYSLEDGHEYIYTTNNNGSHDAFCVDLDDPPKAYYCDGNTCSKCGYIFPQNGIAVVDVSGSQPAYYPWTAAGLQQALDNAANQAGIVLLGDSKNTPLQLGDQGVALSGGKTVFFKLGGQTITYTGTGNAITVPAGCALQMEDGTNKGGLIATVGTAIGGNGALSFADVKVEANVGYTIDGGTVNLYRGAKLLGGGVRLSQTTLHIAQPLVNSTICIAVERNPSLPMTIATSAYAPFSLDMAPFCYGKKNRYAGMFLLDTDATARTVRLLPPNMTVSTVPNNLVIQGPTPNMTVTIDSNSKSLTPFNLGRVLMDGKELVIGKDVTVRNGPIVLTVAPAYLSTLAMGAHTLSVNVVTKGSTDQWLQIGQIVEPDVPTPSPSPVPVQVPKTGDSANPVLWLSGVVLALLTMLFILIDLRKRAMQTKRKN